MCAGLRLQRSVWNQTDVVVHAVNSDSSVCLRASHLAALCAYANRPRPEPRIVRFAAFPPSHAMQQHSSAYHTPYVHRIPNAAKPIQGAALCVQLCGIVGPNDVLLSVVRIQYRLPSHVLRAPLFRAVNHSSTISASAEYPF